MKCGKCGRDNAENFNYCIHCGAVIEHEAVKAVRRRMGFFRRIFIQLIIIILILGGVAYWLSTRNIIVVHRSADNTYTAYFAFVGRERLYLADDGEIQFSERKVAADNTFPEGMHMLNVRLDACHYGLGSEPTLEAVVTKPDDKSFTPQRASMRLPDGGCDTDRDIALTGNIWLPAGKYSVQFFISHYKGDTIELKSITFTVTPHN